MSDDAYRVKLQGEGVVIEREVTGEVGRRIAVLVLTGTEQPVKSDRGSESGRSASKDDQAFEMSADGMSAREFLNEHEPRRAPDKLTTLALYLKRYSDKKVVTAADLRTALENA